MSIQFNCGTCGRQFTVPENMAGIQARCETCGAIVTVPGGLEPTGALEPIAGTSPALAPYEQGMGAAGYPAQPVGAPGPAQTPAGAYVAQPSQPSGGVPKIVWILAIGGGGLIVLGIACLIVLSALFGGSDEPESPGEPTEVASQTPDASGTTTSVPSTPSRRSAREQTSSPTYRPPVTITPPSAAGPNRPTDSTSPFKPVPAPSSPSSTTPTIPSTEGTTDNSRSPTAPPSVGNRNETMPAVPNLADLARAAREGNLPRPSDFRRSGSGDSGEENRGGADWIPWEATADAPEQEIKYKSGKLSITAPSFSKVIFPDRPSNFVMVTGRDEQRRDFWRVFDLRSGKEIGEPVYPEEHVSSPMFSPDGRYVMGRLNVRGKLVYGVWSFVSGEFERELGVGGHFVTFAAPHQLLSVNSQLDDSTVSLWDVRTSEKIQEFTILHDRDHRPVRDTYALTPGGRFLSLIEGDRLVVYELASGGCAGHAPVPGTPRRCSAMAYSQDGSELAALLSFSHGSDLHLVCWDFISGDIALSHEYDGGSRFGHSGDSLQWLPDKSALLYRGSVLLDRETGMEIWTFPEDRSNPRRMLGLDRMLTVVRGRGGSGLAYVDLPEKDLENAMESIRGGGKAVDSVLPKLVQGNVLSARTMSLPNGFTDWAATPGSAGTAPEVDRDLMIAAQDETLKAALFAAPDSGKVAVQKTARRSTGSSRNSQQITFVERYDVTSGRKSKEIPLPMVYDMLDVSPSGDFVLVGFRQSSGGYDRLDVIGFSPLEHIVGWRPYEGEEQTGSNRSSGDPKTSKRSVMLDDTHVLTVNAKGKLTVWELPDCTAVFSFQDFGTPIAFSPMRKYMVGVHNQELRIFETATGECRGDLETPHTGVSVHRAAFRPDGSQLAAVIVSGNDRALATWDAQTGKLQSEFPLPPDVLRSTYHSGGSSLEWRGGRHLMLDHQYLIDLENRAVVWRYHLQHGNIYAARGPDHRTWFCTTRERSFSGPKFLIAVDTPSVGARQKTEFTTLEEQLVLGPGMSVRLNVQLGGDLRQKAEQAVTDALQAQGIKVDPAAKLQFVVTTRQGTTGTQIGVTKSRSPFGRFHGRPETTFAQQQISCQMAIKDAAGKDLWSYERKVAMRSYGMVKTENAQSELNQEMRQSFDGMMSSGSFIRDGLPTYIFGDLSEILAGASTLTFRGEEAPPAPPKART